MKKRTLYGAIALVVIGLSLVGCSEKTQVTKSEEANWKGGPMPADFKPNIGSGPPKTASAAPPAAAVAAPPAAK